MDKIRLTLVLNIKYQSSHITTNTLLITNSNRLISTTLSTTDLIFIQL